MPQAMEQIKNICRNRPRKLGYANRSAHHHPLLDRQAQGRPPRLSLALRRQPTGVARRLLLFPV